MAWTKHIARTFSLFCIAAICLGPRAAQRTIDNARALPILGYGWSQWVINMPLNVPTGARNWCCFDGMGTQPKTCDLDNPRLNFGSISDGRNGRDAATQALQSGTVHIYADVVQGKLQRLRVFGADCPVSAKTPIATLGKIETGSSPN